MTKKLFSGTTLLFLLLSILSSAFLYRNSFGAFYFQDDWFSLKISQAKNISDIAGFFIPRQDVIYYRPLGMQLPFYLMQTLFGINPLPFHILTFLTHALNIILVYILVFLLLQNKKAALAASFLYAVSSVCFIPMYWSATYAFILCPTLFFASFLFFLFYITNKSLTDYVLSFIFFATGLLVNEIIVILPAILFLYLLFFKKAKQLLATLIYFVTGLLLFLLRFTLFSPPTSGNYHLGVGWNIVSNIKTYLFWSLNWSEILTEQMTRILFFNRLITANYPWYAYVSDFLFIALLVLIVIGLLNFVRVKENVGNLGKYTAFPLLWFAIGLLPVLLFSGHKFAYYLPISLLGLIIFFVWLFSSCRWANKTLQKVSLGIFILVWFLFSLVSVSLNDSVHWAPRRAKLSAELTQKAKQETVKSSYKTLIFNIPDNSENRLALNGQDGFQVFFHNSKIKTDYVK
ncbi:glycosyltransferase family 39 protein [Patescibacteria group bacterium]|nr:glycosyltransferase family 39 protein [Patescibacteria group bacterium]MCL5797999.1 glycosyltransferase family 39 protein [Patescibacteria group bacterium]